MAASVGSITTQEVASGSISYLLKKVYSQRDIENAVYKDNPVFAMIRKASGFTGQSHIHGVRYRDGLGRNSTFYSATAAAGAQGLAAAAAGTSKGVQFVLERVRNYQVYQLDTEAILAGRDDKGSLMRVLTTEVDAALNNIGRNMAIDMFRDGFASLGALTAVPSSVSGTSTPAATACTWTVGDAITNFEVGMSIQVAAATSSANTRNATTTSSTIDTIDRAAGTFTTTANAPTGSTTGDHLYLLGDRAETSAVRTKIAGFDAWNPSAVTSTAFFGVDRTADSTRLGGLRLDISTLNPEEGLMTALHTGAREGANFDILALSFADSLNIQKSLGAKAESQYMSMGDIGFSTIMVRGPKGDVRIVPDQNCPLSVGRLLNLSSWELFHLGDMLNMLDQDGSRLSRLSTADTFEGRIAFYGNMRCFAPGQNMRLVLPS